MQEYELHQLKIIQKSKRIFISILILNVLLGILPLFVKGETGFAVTVLCISAVLELLVFFDVKGATNIWGLCAAVQLLYYFVHVGKYVTADYPMPYFFIMILRSVFCLYSGWAFLINYDVKDYVHEHGKALKKHFSKQK